MWQQILRYFYLRKPDSNDPKKIDVKLMHGMNRISLFMFLLGIIVMLYRILRH